MVCLTSAIAHVNAHNTVHKNNVHISLEIEEFPVPQNHSVVHPHNTDNKTASVVSRGGRAVINLLRSTEHVAKI